MRIARPPYSTFRRFIAGALASVFLTFSFIPTSIAADFRSPDEIQSSHYFSIGSQELDVDYVYDSAAAARAPWWHRLLGTFKAWAFNQGEDITVAVVDTGVDLDNADLADQLWRNAGEIEGDGIDNDGNGYVDDVHGWDFAYNDSNPDDGHYHGTHVAGIVAASGEINSNVMGIAPAAKIMAVKVLGDDGSGSIAGVIAGIMYAAQMGAKVINMSLGAASLPAYWINAMQAAVDFAKGLGSVVIASAGNSGNTVSPGLGYPGKLNNVISVGATTSVDGRASFSSYGNELDIMAPGYQINSLIPDDRTGVLSGTSMAAPMVSGLAALLLAQDSTLGHDGVWRRMKFSASDLNTVGWDQTTGYGRIDAYRALSYDYFDSGAVKTHYLAQPDVFGAVRYDYDVLGRTTQISYANGNKQTFTYWGNEQKIRSDIRTDSGNRVIRRVEYFESRRIRILEENGLTFEYDQSGNVVRRIDAEGNVWTTSFAYKGDGRLRSRSDYRNGVRTVELVYNQDGTKRFENIYDNDGTTLKSRTWFDSSGNVASKHDFANGYLTAETQYDPEGRTGKTYTYFANSTRLYSITQFFVEGSDKRIQTFGLDGKLSTEVRYFSNGQVRERKEYTGGVLNRFDQYLANGLAVNLNGIAVVTRPPDSMDGFDFMSFGDEQEWDDEEGSYSGLNR